MQILHMIGIGLLLTILISSKMIAKMDEEIAEVKIRVLELERFNRR